MNIKLKRCMLAFVCVIGIIPFSSYLEGFLFMATVNCRDVEPVQVALFDMSKNIILEQSNTYFRTLGIIHGIDTQIQLCLITK